MHSTPWPHAPTHKLAESGTFIVTARTYDKAHCFRGPERLAVLQRGLLTMAQKFNWQLEAWAVFSNQYTWCSAGWYEGEAPPAMVKSVYRFKTEQIKIDDDFEIAPEW